MRFEDKKPDGCFLVGNVDSDREREEPCMDRMDRSAGSEDPPRETLLLLFPPFHLDRKKKPKTGNQSRQLGRKPNGEKTREDWGRRKKVKEYRQTGIRRYFVRGVALNHSLIDLARRRRTKCMRRSFSSERQKKKFLARWKSNKNRWEICGAKEVEEEKKVRRRPKQQLVSRRIDTFMVKELGLDEEGVCRQSISGSTSTTLGHGRKEKGAKMIDHWGTTRAYEWEVKTENKLHQ